jgi:hypothetical protein
MKPPSPPGSDAASPPDDVVDFLTRGIEQAARTIEGRALREALPRINERDHLQPAFTAALREIADSWEPAPVVDVGRALSLSEDFDRLGGVDNSLRWNAGPTTFIELKAGDDLSACAWDALKLVAALRGGACDRVFLIAAAPTDRWLKASDPSPASRSLPGAEFFGVGHHESAELRDRYASSWRRWSADGYRPKRAAAALRTVPLSTARFTVGGAADTQWEIRLSEVVDERDATSGEPGWIAWRTP